MNDRSSSDSQIDQDAMSGADAAALAGEPDYHLSLQECVDKGRFCTSEEWQNWGEQRAAPNASALRDLFAEMDETLQALQGVNDVLMGNAVGIDLEKACGGVSYVPLNGNLEGKLHVAQSCLVRAMQQRLYRVLADGTD